jgi:hypothetical protein
MNNTRFLDARQLTVACISRPCPCRYGRGMARSRERIGLPILADREVPLYAGDMEADLRVVSRHRLAETITGGLSKPGKMPCPAWGLPASECRTGSRLVKIEGTTCHDCYALKGTFRFKGTIEKYRRRFEGIFHPLWTPAMVFLVRYFCDRYLRLFESGDIAGGNHLKNIITVARHVPDVQIWCPTREIETLRSVHRELMSQAIAIPDNLTIRVSAHLVDGDPPSWWPTTSTVTSAQEAGEGICPAREQENRCDECRACWDADVANVAYRLH